MKNQDVEIKGIYGGMCRIIQQNDTILISIEDRNGKHSAIDITDEDFDKFVKEYENCKK